MKKLSITLALVFGLIVASIGQTQYSWTQKADFMGSGRTGAVAFSIGDKGYVGTGWDSITRFKDFWQYNSATDTWSQKADFGGAARYGAVGFSAGAKGYVGTGNTTQGATNDFWQYDTVANQWSQKSNFPGVTRYGGVGFSLPAQKLDTQGNFYYKESVGYLGTGTGNNNTLLKDFWQYQPFNDVWTQLQDFPGFARTNAVGFAGSHTAFVGTGKAVNGGPQIYVNDLWRFSPDSATMWQQLPNLPGRRSSAIGFCVAGIPYVGLGKDSTGITNKKDMYAFLTVSGITGWGTVSSATLPDSARCGSVSFVIGNKGYVSTGNNINNSGLHVNTTKTWEFYTGSFVFSLNSLNYCTGDTIILSYNTGVATLNNGNVFSLLINNTPVATLSSTSATGVIKYVIPSSNSYSPSYTISLSTSSPVHTVGDSTQAIINYSYALSTYSIREAFNAPLNDICPGSSPRFLLLVNAGNYNSKGNWYYNTNLVMSDTSMYSFHPLNSYDSLWAVIIDSNQCIHPFPVFTNKIIVLPAPSYTLSSSGNACAATDNIFVRNNTPNRVGLVGGDTIQFSQGQTFYNYTPTDTIFYTTNNFASQIPFASVFQHYYTGYVPFNPSNFFMTYNYYLNYTGPLYALVHNGNGCYSYTDTININGLIAIKDSISPTAFTVCLDTALHLSAAALNPGTNPIYQWYKNGNPVGNNSFQYTDTTYNVNDSIWAELTTSNLCPYPPIASSNRVHALPGTKGIHILENGGDLCLPDTVVLYLQNNFPNYTYNWSTGQTGKSISVSNGGTYSVSGVSSHGCLTSIDTLTITPVANCGGEFLIQSDSIINYFDTLHVNVAIEDASNLFSIFAKLHFDTIRLKYLDSQAGNFLGTSIINTPPAVTNGTIDFGMTKTNGQSGSSGNGIVYSFRFKLNQLPYNVPFDSINPQNGFTILALDNPTVNDSSGLQRNVGMPSPDTVLLRYYIPVWPGDLNNDKTVDVSDILPIGYYYNKTGGQRPNRSINWSAQAAPVWGYDNSTPHSDASSVFADGNGDGKINLADQNSIGFNLNNFHLKTDENYQRSYHSSPAGIPSLSVTLSDSMLPLSQLPHNLTATINIGSSNTPITDLYGLSFRLSFDPAYVDFNNVQLDYSHSIFGTLNTDYVKIEDTLSSQGKIEIGMTRYNTSPINGDGQLVIVTLPLKAQVPQGWLHIDAIKLAANDEQGAPQDLGSGSDSVLIGSAQAINSIKSIDDLITVFPNPSNGHFVLSITQPSKLFNIELTNVQGQQLFVEQLKDASSLKKEFNLSDFAKGIYLLKVSCENGVVVKRLVVE